MTFVKFCGLTRDEDVDFAAALGVNALGFVLWPQSPRAVSLERLDQLVSRLPAAIVPVGVFVRPTHVEIERAVDAGVRAVQIHGAEPSPQFPFDVDVWVAGSLAGESLTVDVPEDRLLVLDAHDPEKHGGTGRTIDWSTAAPVAARRRVLLAGGLTPSNVADAIRIVRPFGVDVASGIERRPGVKDASAMQDFVAQVRQVTS